MHSLLAKIIGNRSRCFWVICFKFNKLKLWIYKVHFIFFNSVMPLLCTLTDSVLLQSSVEYSDRCNGIHSLQIYHPPRTMVVWFRVCTRVFLNVCTIVTIYSIISCKVVKVWRLVGRFTQRKIRQNCHCYLKNETQILSIVKNI